LLLFLEEGHASLFSFFCSLIGAYIFLCFLSIYFFFNDPSPFARLKEEKSILDFGVFMFGGWMACFV
jgi:hypothetical protein